MNLIDNYLAAEKSLYEYFGYEQGNHIMPIMDWREYYWQAKNEKVYFDETKFQFLYHESEDSLDSYAMIDKVYRGEGATLIPCDMQAYGSFFLFIFDNAKEVAQTTAETAVDSPECNPGSAPTDPVNRS